MKKKRANASIIVFGKDKIVRVVFIKNSNITVRTLKDDYRVYSALVGKNVFPLLISAQDNVNFTSEAMSFASKLVPGKISAVAVVVNNISYRLMGEFFSRVYNPSVPYKVFSRADEAVHWLNLYS